MTALLLIAVAYLLGTVPTAIIVSRRRGRDPTAQGSGNPGASNVYRLAGRRAGAVVLVVDLAKGAIATLAGLAVGGRPLALACGAAAVVGHIAPVTRRFHGGKGVATAAGMGIVLYPVVAVPLAALFATVALLTGRAAVASLTVAIAFPAGVALSGRPAWEVGVAAAVAAVVVVRHRANLGRLRRGEERRLTGPGP